MIIKVWFSFVNPFFLSKGDISDPTRPSLGDGVGNLPSPSALLSTGWYKHTIQKKNIFYFAFYINEWFAYSHENKCFQVMSQFWSKFSFRISTKLQLPNLDLKIHSWCHLGHPYWLKLSSQKLLFMFVAIHIWREVLLKVSKSTVRRFGAKTLHWRSLHRIHNV